MTGGTVTTAEVAGRDSSTNIAVLRPKAPLASSSITTNEARAGAIVLAIGADGTGGASARLGIVNVAGPEWHSSRGGLIDRRTCSTSALRGLRRAVPYSMPPAGASACRHLARAARSLLFRRQPSTASYGGTQGRTCRAGMVGRYVAGCRRARCAARNRRPVERFDGYVSRRKWSRGASGNCGRGHHIER